MKPRGLIGGHGLAAERYEFGAVVVDATAHTLHRDGEPHPVEPKSFAVLLVLLRHAGELVSRDDLLDAVWGHRHVTPGVLTRAIAQLRHALDDDSHRPRFIQTQHALGYRFIGEIRAAAPVQDQPSAATVASEGIAAPADVPAAAPDATLGSGFAGPGEPVDRTAAAGRVTGETPATATRDDTGTATAPTAAVTTAAATSGPRRPLLVPLAVLLVAAAMLSATAWLWPGRDPASTPTEASIAVLPFTSLSSDRDDSYFAEGLAEELHNALAGVPGLKVAAIGSGGAGRDVKAVGATLGVATVLDASVRRDGDRVRITARLSDTDTGFTLWTNSFDRETADVFALQSDIAHEVVQALLGVLPERAPLEKRLTPTRDIVAYDAYLKGLHQLQASAGETSLDNAVAFFNEALAADAGFGRAQAGICRAELARFESVRDAAAFDRAQTACLRAADLDPGLREVSLALGEMHRVRGEFSQATTHYTRALDDLALRPAAYIGLARTQGAQGRNALALDYFERARQLRPGDAMAQRELGYHHYLNGDLPAAIAAYRKATDLQPGDAGLWNSLGGLYLANGETAPANDAFERSLAISPGYGALSNLGTLRYAQGRYEEAADLYRHAAEIDPEDYRIWGNIGDALSAVPATATQAHEAYASAADRATRYVGIRADDAQALALLAWYRANLGDADGATGLMARAEALDVEPAEVALANAQTLALLGEHEAAAQRLARARAAGITRARVHASPVLRELAASSAIPPPATAQ